jgi:CRISPR-associated protein Cas2
MMVVMILERVPSGLRGKLTRWLLEPRAGVFIGTVSAEVRERLWNLSRQKGGRKGAGILVYSSNTEQGFRVQSFGDGSREMIDCEGLQLVRKPQKEGEFSEPKDG